MRRAGGRTVSDSLTILINLIQAVDNVTPAKMTFTVEFISDSKVNIKSVQHARLRGNNSTTATSGGIRNSSVGNVHIAVFVGTDEMLNDIIVTLHKNLDLADAVNGLKLSVIFPFKRKVAGIATRKTNLLGDVWALKSRWVLRGFSHHIDVSQLFQRPTQVLAVPNVSRGHIIPGDNTSFTTTFELPFRESFGISGDEVDRTSEGDAKSSRFTLAMRTVIRATFFVDFPVDDDGRSVLKDVVQRTARSIRRT